MLYSIVKNEYLFNFLDFSLRFLDCTIKKLIIQKSEVLSSLYFFSKSS